MKYKDLHEFVFYKFHNLKNYYVQYDDYTVTIKHYIVHKNLKYYHEYIIEKLDYFNDTKTWTNLNRDLNDFIKNTKTSQ
jgi:hypothetical protein